MTLLEHGVFVTIAASVVCWAAGEALRSRVGWTLGALLALVHSVLSFAVFLDWSHEKARMFTARQTDAVTGTAFGGGIYVNYLFLVVWIADVVWWWWSPRSYTVRPAAISFAIRGFIFFIVFNGAVVFADGLARLVGIISTAVVVVPYLVPRLKPRPAGW